MESFERYEVLLLLLFEAGEVEEEEVVVRTWQIFLVLWLALRMRCVLEVVAAAAAVGVGEEV